VSDLGIPATPPPGAPSEPLAKVGGLVTAITAITALVVAFGLKLSDAQVAAILGVAAVLAPIITTVWGRLKVWSPATARAAILAAGRHREGSRRMPYTPTTKVVDEP
jgi:hypothetical protein